MEKYSRRILEVKELIKNTDYTLIGADSGFSTAVGLKYEGESNDNKYRL